MGRGSEEGSPYRQAMGSAAHLSCPGATTEGPMTQGPSQATRACLQLLQMPPVEAAPPVGLPAIQAEAQQSSVVPRVLLWVHASAAQHPLVCAQHLGEGGLQLPAQAVRQTSGMRWDCSER